MVAARRFDPEIFSRLSGMSRDDPEHSAALAATHFSHYRDRAASAQFNAHSGEPRIKIPLLAAGTLTR